jgi:hypothetical protein
MNPRLTLLALLLAGASAGCPSPEALRTQGGGPGGDVGNRSATYTRTGAKIYYKTPCRTVKVKCSGPEPTLNPSAT